MIRYSLVCDQGHDFESWFATGASYDSQARRKLIACPVCHSQKVTKAVMAPSIAGVRKNALSPSPTESPVPVALLDERQQRLRSMARRLRAEIEKNTVDVGGEFPRIARAIHEGEEPQRSIRGQATPAEARSLIEDGIGVLPLPLLPDEIN
jgi:hypothetical protein